MAADVTYTRYSGCMLEGCQAVLTRLLDARAISNSSEAGVREPGLFLLGLQAAWSWQWPQQHTPTNALKHLASDSNLPEPSTAKQAM